ncbi:MAG: EamA family transporter [Thermoflavifilum sp.]|nr:EamA family transporter [Thermoflavifilum sp.]
MPRYDLALRQRWLTPAYVALGLVSFFWGTTYFAIRIGVAHMPGLMLASIRQTLAGSMLILIYLLKGQRLPNIRELSKLLVMGVLLLGISNGLMSWGEEYVPSGLTAILAAVYPITMAVFSLWFLPGTHFTRQLYVGMLLGLAGVLFIFYPNIWLGQQAHFLWGALLILLSTVSWSAGTIYATKHSITLPLLFATGWQMLFGGISLVPICWITGNIIPLRTIPAQAWWAILYLIGFGSLIGYVAYIYAIHHLPPAQVSIYAYINPIVAVILGAIWLHEPIDLRIATGSLITLVGVVLVQRSFQRTG